MDWEKYKYRTKSLSPNGRSDHNLLFDILNFSIPLNDFCCHSILVDRGSHLPMVSVRGAVGCGYSLCSALVRDRTDHPKPHATVPRLPPSVTVGNHNDWTYGMAMLTGADFITMVSKRGAHSSGHCFIISLVSWTLTGAQMFPSLLGWGRLVDYTRVGLNQQVYIHMSRHIQWC